MIDPLQLATDIAGDVAVLALPAVLWALLYQLAWEHGPFAESIGFGRRTFWLLVVGGLLGLIVVLPLTPIKNDWLAISYSGAVFPLIVVGFGLAAISPPARRTLPPFVGLLVLETGALLAVVLLVPGAVASLAALFAIAVAMPLLTYVLARQRPGDVGSATPAVLALFSGMLMLTFLASTAIPGVGIEETFPAYLVGPFVLGLVAAVAASSYVPGREALALPTAYAAGTLGVLVGADVLRQPPLYGSGPSGLYAIGGAGVLDLVYLSGLIALAGAYVAHRLLKRGFAPVPGGIAEPPPTPLAQLQRAFRSGLRGEIPTAIDAADRASRDSAAQAHRLLNLPAAPDDRPWEGLPVPGWVVSDQANLDAVVPARSTDGREGLRAYLTARWLVLLGRQLGLPRFASLGRRTAAFGIDLVLVTVPAALLWWGILALTPGTLDQLAANLPFNAALYGYAALAFLYFALMETVNGWTVGKRVLGLEVRDRHLNRPSLLAGLVRNVSLLPTLTLIAFGLGVGLLVLLKSGGGTVLGVIGGLTVSSGAIDFAIILGVVIAGVGLLGMVAVLVIMLTSERQRWGDLAAGTWVVRSLSGPAFPPPVARAVPTASTPAPPAAGPHAG